MEREATANVTFNIEIVNTSNTEMVPTAYLSDVDDISDVEVVDEAVDQLQKTMTSKPVYNERRSVFNITLDQDELGAASNNVANCVEAYKERVAREKQSWEAFAESVLKSGTAGKGTGIEPAASYTPSKEQQAYLNQAPNLQNFIRGSGAFMNDSSKFMLEFEKMRDLQEDLKDSCQQLINNKKRNAIAEHLAKCHKNED